VKTERESSKDSSHDCCLRCGSGPLLSNETYEQILAPSGVVQDSENPDLCDWCGHITSKERFLTEG